MSILQEIKRSLTRGGGFLEKELGSVKKHKVGNFFCVEIEVSSYEYRMKYASFWLKTKPTMFLKRKLIQQISKEVTFFTNLLYKFPLVSLKKLWYYERLTPATSALETPYGGKFTLLTQLMKSNYLLYCFVSVVPEGNGRGG